MSVSNAFGGNNRAAAKYSWLLMKLQEYPVNKEMLRLIEKDIGPSSPSVMEVPGLCGYGRPTESKAIKQTA